MLLLLPLIVACLLPFPVYAESNIDREYPIIAAYIYNFTQFTTWPAASLEDELDLCIFGNDHFGDLLTPLRAKTIQEKKIEIHYEKAITNHLRGCDVLFITVSETKAMSLVLAKLVGSPTLTMSNIPGFSKQGGMVEFTKEYNKIGLHINNKAIRKSGLSVSSKLLSLAHIVE